MHPTDTLLPAPPKMPQPRNFRCWAWLPAFPLQFTLPQRPLNPQRPDPCKHWVPAKSGVVAENFEGLRDGVKSIRAAPPGSVNGPQNAPGLGVLQHVLPQPVVMLGTGLSKSTFCKRQMAVGIQAGGNPQGIP